MRVGEPINWSTRNYQPVNRSIPGTPINARPRRSVPEVSQVPDSGDCLDCGVRLEDVYGTFICDCCGRAYRG